MKPPPLLLGFTLLFWGWQSDLFLLGALMAVILESAQVFKVRWDFSDDDFTKAWSFCSLVLLAAIIYSFTNNEGPSSFATMFDDLSLSNQRTATNASARTAAEVIRWVPIIFFPFLAAQTFSTRESIPLATISLILQRRWRKAKSLGQPAPTSRGFNIGYPYFCATLLAASFHPSDDNSFFWGFCVLLTWVLWTHRSRRFAVAVWFAVLAVAVAAGFFGQRGVAQAQAYLTNLNPQWLANFMRRTDDPFQNRTSMGVVGRLKTSGRIVIRLEPDKRTTSRISISCYLDGYDKGSPAGLLPLPSGTARLEKLYAFTLDQYSAGSVMAHGPGLVIFDALYGPGATIDSPPGYGTTTNPRGRRLYEESGLGRFEPRRDGIFTNDPPVFIYATTNEDLAVPPIETAAVPKTVFLINDLRSFVMTRYLSFFIIVAMSTGLPPSRLLSSAASINAQIAIVSSA